MTEDVNARLIHTEVSYDVTYDSDGMSKNTIFFLKISKITLLAHTIFFPQA